MTRKYFGTDGIRGTANTPPMTAEIALRVAMATAKVLKNGAASGDGDTPRPRVVIGKDTRLSAYMFEQALTAGFLAMGMDVLLTGPVPTPAVAMLTRSLRADIGIMVSASHNPYQDNGIKIFGADGYKLADDTEKEIEHWMERSEDLATHAAKPEAMGKAARIDDAGGRYAEFLKSSLPRGENFSGLKLVIDCANGAAYKIAPSLLWEMEAEVVAIGTAPNGRNINEKCGATDTKALQERVVAEGADLGIALDGDADRLILVDETGAQIDGDQILACLALHMKQQGTLFGDTVAATVMSNLGLERTLAQNGITLARTKVGDRYVVEEMRAHGYMLGGEQSGHVVLSDFGTTGDGLLSALQILSILKRKNVKASEGLKAFTPLPQILKNVRYQGDTPLEDKSVQETIETIRRDLNERGRVLVRASGTEPVIRVMAEGDDLDTIEGAVNKICDALESVAKRA